MAVDTNKQLFPDPEPHVVDIEKAKGHDIFEGGSSQVRQLIRTNDILLLTDGPREPGEVIENEWHNHLPTTYQIMIVIQGTVRHQYKDKEGEEHTVDASEGEVLFLPGGIENKIMTVGDTPMRSFTIMPAMPVNRVEHLLANEKEHLDVYDPSEVPKSLDVDTIRDIIIDIDREAVRSP